MSCNILLLIVSPLGIELDKDITINPNPVRHNVIELDVVAIVTIVWNDFNNGLNVLYFLYFFSDFWWSL